MSQLFAYTIMPDFGMAWAWQKDASDESAYIGSNMADACGWSGDHPISKSLENDFIAWAQKFETTDLHIPEVAMRFDWTRFHEQGIALSIRLKSELRESARVYYAKPYEDPDHESDELVEVLGNCELVAVHL